MGGPVWTQGLRWWVWLRGEEGKETAKPEGSAAGPTTSRAESQVRRGQDCLLWVLLGPNPPPPHR